MSTDKLKISGEIFGYLQNPLKDEMGNYMVDKDGKIIYDEPVLVDHKKNAIGARLYRACARALASGVFRGEAGGSADQPVSYLAFVTTGATVFNGKRNSDDLTGVDLSSGGTGADPYAEFEAYHIAESSITIETVRISHEEQFSAGVVWYADATVSRPLVQDQKYTVRYRITFQAA